MPHRGDERVQLLELLGRQHQIVPSGPGFAGRSPTRRAPSGRGPGRRSRAGCLGRRRELRRRCRRRPGRRPRPPYRPRGSVATPWRRRAARSASRRSPTDRRSTGTATVSAGNPPSSVAATSATGESTSATARTSRPTSSGGESMTSNIHAYRREHRLALHPPQEAFPLMGIGRQLAGGHVQQRQAGHLRGRRHHRADVARLRTVHDHRPVLPPRLDDGTGGVAEPAGQPWRRGDRPADGRQRHVEMPRTGEVVQHPLVEGERAAGGGGRVDQVHEFPAPQRRRRGERAPVRSGQHAQCGAEGEPGPPRRARRVRRRLRRRAPVRPPAAARSVRSR